MPTFDKNRIAITVAENFRRVLSLLFIGGFFWLAWWVGVLEVWASPLVVFAMLPAPGVEFLISRPKVREWLERKQPVETGTWRTARGPRIVTFWSLLIFAVYGCLFVFRARHAWAGGDMPRFAGGVLALALLASFVGFVVVRRLTSAKELARRPAVDRHRLRRSSER
jgi:hypothetical protein